MRSSIETRSSDGSVEPDVQQHVSEFRANMLAMLPEEWDQHQLLIHDEYLQTCVDKDEPRQQAAADMFRGLALCGMKQGAVYAGLENSGVASFRLQAREFVASKCSEQATCWQSCIVHPQWPSMHV